QFRRSHRRRDRHRPATHRLLRRSGGSGSRAADQHLASDQHRKIPGSAEAFPSKRHKKSKPADQAFLTMEHLFLGKNDLPF
ncbi:hypothetical protein, partial [Mesorhizobium sp. M4B.F.Ca.ET.215.01.1.1]|uniref:hypothetical protein n=1 Tax=Mesorhizobium sp. M4B.F.Ca.ET.215.01.1.1 TaxID=2563956 RepID=UPI001AED3A7E